jgi:hypothetical protein
VSLLTIINKSIEFIMFYGLSPCLHGLYNLCLPEPACPQRSPPLFAECTNVELFGKLGLSFSYLITRYIIHHLQFFPKTPCLTNYAFTTSWLHKVQQSSNGRSLAWIFFSLQSYIYHITRAKDRTESTSTTLAI